MQTCIMAQLMPLPLTVPRFSKIQIGFTFLIPAHRVVPEKGPLNGCVCVCVCVCVLLTRYVSVKRMTNRRRKDESQNRVETDARMLGLLSGL